MNRKIKAMLMQNIAASVLIILMAITPQASFAAGSGDDTGSSYGTAGSGSATVTKAQKATNNNDFAAAYTILENAVASEANNADIHNLLGFSARKMGRYEDSMRHYQQALILDPKHKGALEYMGELYLTLGQPDEARALLERLGDICWLGCAEERELKTAIDAWESANN